MHIFLTKTVMNRKRASASKELLHYKRKVRGVEEPKYHFSVENFIPRKRKRFARNTDSFVSEITRTPLRKDILPTIAEDTLPSIADTSSITDSTPPSITEDNLPSIAEDTPPSITEDILPSIAENTPPSIIDSTPPSITLTSITDSEATHPSIAGSVVS